jgi:hypothetical protein
MLQMKLNQLALWLMTVAVTAATPVAAQSLNPQDFPYLAGVNNQLDPTLQVSDDQKIEAGRSVCNQLQSGQTFGQLIAQESQAIESQPLKLQYSIRRYHKAVKEYAIRNYCPEFSKQWRAWH